MVGGVLGLPGGTRIPVVCDKGIITALTLALLLLGDPEGFVWQGLTPPLSFGSWQ